MKKLVLGLIAGLAAASLAFAEVDSKAQRRLDNLENGNSIGVLYKAADITATDDVTAGDDVVAGGDAVIAGATTTATLRVTGASLFSGIVRQSYASSVPATNGLIMLGTSRSADYSAAAQGSITTTNTLAAPGAGSVGAFITINNVGVSNAILISRSTTILGPSITLSPTGSVTLLGYDANSWIATGKYP